MNSLLTRGLRNAHLRDSGDGRELRNGPQVELLDSEIPFARVDGGKYWWKSLLGTAYVKEWQGRADRLCAQQGRQVYPYQDVFRTFDEYPSEKPRRYWCGAED